MTAVMCIRKGELSTWSVCLCPDCSERSRRLHKLARNGRFHRIPPEQGLAVLLQMMDADMTNMSIATAIGVSPATVSGWLTKIRAGKTLRLGAIACVKLLSAQQPTDGLVGTVVPMRMLRALARIGWSATELTRLAQQRGLTIGMNTLWTIRKGRTAKVHAVVANAIADLYRDLHMTPGSAEQTIRIAIAEDWPAPLAWDDITNLQENPVGMHDRHQANEGLDEAAIERRMAGDRTAKTRGPENFEVVRRLLAQGHSQRWISIHTGLKAERYLPQNDTGPETIEIEQEVAA